MNTKSRYRIRSQGGRLKRVNVEHGILDPVAITRLQENLRTKTPGSRPKLAVDLHLTLFHFGQPEDLFKAILAEQPDLDFRVYLGYFMELIMASEHIVPQPLAIHGTELAMFGNSDQPTLVLRLASNDQLTAAHHAVGALCLEFLERCGVSNTQAFMNRSYLSYQRDDNFKPHISLARLPRPQLVPDLRQDVVVELTPSRLRNVEVMMGGQWVWSH